MTFDFNSLKIQTFTGINDNPVSPTASKAGNGSHIVAQFNALIDALNENILSNDWIIVKDNYQAEANKKLLFDFNSFALRLIFPPDPKPGNQLTLLKIADTNYNLSIDLNGKPLQGTYPSAVDLIYDYTEITLIYVSPEFGWIPNRSNILSVGYYSGGT